MTGESSDIVEDAVPAIGSMAPGHFWVRRNSFGVTDDDIKAAKRGELDPARIESLTMAMVEAKQRLLEMEVSFNEWQPAWRLN